MALNFLQSRLEKTIQKVRSKGTLTEENIQEFLSELRVILLEADVNLSVVKEFINDIKEQSIGEVVAEERTASQKILDIVNKELISLFGSKTKDWSAPAETAVLMVGLQGSGKTTTIAKLAKYLTEKEGYKKPLLVGLDIYRPAAIEQLNTLANSLGFDFFANKESKDVEQISKEALTFAKLNGNDLILVDTAGRLQTDEELMLELQTIKKQFKPSEIIFVADAFSGQEILNVAEEFNNKLSLTSAIITKLDSDTKAGASLSLAKKLGIKIQFIGTGEKVENLELFHPDRMASRILGLGDIETLVEKAQDISDEKKQEKMMRKMLSGSFDLDDLLESMAQMNKMGNIGGIARLMPGMKINQTQTDSIERKFSSFETLINSMTVKEKKAPNILKHPKRKNRILAGSGKTAQDLNELLRDFEKMQKQMKEMAKYIKMGKMPNMGGGFNGMM